MNRTRKTLKLLGILFAVLCLSLQAIASEEQDRKHVQTALNVLLLEGWESRSPIVQKAAIETLGKVSSLDSLYILMGHVSMRLGKTEGFTDADFEISELAIKEIKKHASSRYLGELTEFIRSIESNFKAMTDNVSLVHMEMMFDILEMLRKLHTQFSNAYDKTLPRLLEAEGIVFQSKQVDVADKVYRNYIEVLEKHGPQSKEFRYAIEAARHYPSHEVIGLSIIILREMFKPNKFLAGNIPHGILIIDLLGSVVPGYTKLQGKEQRSRHYNELSKVYGTISARQVELSQKFGTAFADQWPLVKNAFEKALAQIEKSGTKRNIKLVSLAKRTALVDAVKTGTIKSKPAEKTQLVKVEGNKPKLPAIPSDVKSKNDEVLEKARWEDLGKLETKEIVNLIGLGAGYPSDNSIKDKEKGLAYFGRDKEVHEIANILMREKGRVPVLLGTPDSGKRSVVYRFTELAQEGKLPTKAQNARFKNPFVIEMTLDSMLAMLPKEIQGHHDPGVGAPILSNWIRAGVLKLREKSQRPVVVFISDLDHYILKGHLDTFPVSVLANLFAEAERHNLDIILSVDSSKFQEVFDGHAKLLEKIQKISVNEFSNKDLVQATKKRLAPRVEQQYRVKFTDEALEVIVNRLAKLQSDASLFAAIQRSLEDMAIEATKNQPNRLIHINGNKVYKYIQENSKLPVNPYDTKGFVKYLNGLEKTINENVVDQKRMVKDTVATWRDLLMSEKDAVRVINLNGPTSTGKSELAFQMSKAAGGGFMEISGNVFKEKHDVKTLLGAPPSYAGYEKGGGELIQFLSDPARGAELGFLVINEFDKMNTDIIEALMELFDGKGIRAGDGDLIVPKRLMIFLTGNRGGNIILPEGIENWTDAEVDRHIDSLSEKDLRDLYTRSLSANDSGKLKQEVVNRIHKFSVPYPITKTRAKKILRLKADRYAADLKSRPPSIDLKIDDKFLDHIIKARHTLQGGVRPIQELMVTKLNEALTEVKSKWNFKGDGKIKLTVVGENRDARIVVSEPGGREIKLSFPEVETFDPFTDKATREMLENFESKMSEKLIGQEYVIRSIAEALISHTTDINKVRPLTITMIGSTGTGKTQTGKAAAYALTGDETRHELIALGEIITDSDFETKFGFSAKYGGEESEFERALRNNPKGGVIIFDELSNMGGDDFSRKDRLCKKFYTMIDEGFWISPTTGIRYELGKYIFLFTGNEGELILQGAGESDELRLNAWERNKSRAMLERVLMASGVPEAFLGRQADIIMSRPLVQEVLAKITNKMIQEGLSGIIRDRKIKVEFDKEFVRQVGKTFFSHGSGARSIRRLVEDRLRSYITSTLFAFSEKTKGNFKGYTVRLRMNDNAPKTPYLPSDSFERKVNMEVELVNPRGKVLENKVVNITEFAPEVFLATKRNAMETSFHEAGHAVVNIPKISRQKVEAISIVPGKGWLGFTLYTPLPGGKFSTHNKERVIAEAASLLAGGLAQKLAGYSLDFGWSNDLERANALIFQALTRGGLSKAFHGVRVSKEQAMLSGEEARIVEEEKKEWVAEAEKMALDILEKNWNLVRELTYEIYTKGTVSGAEFETLRKKFEANPGERVWIVIGKDKFDYRITRSQEKAARSTIKNSCRVTIGFNTW